MGVGVGRRMWDRGERQVEELNEGGEECRALPWLVWDGGLD